MPVISYDVAEMVRDFNFLSWDYSPPTARLITFQFVTWNSETVEKIRNKAQPWENARTRNLQTSASESMHKSASDGATNHIDWVYAKAATEVLTKLLTTL